jgi:hypothetical protein
LEVSAIVLSRRGAHEAAGDTSSRLLTAQLDLARQRSCHVAHGWHLDTDRKLASSVLAEEAMRHAHHAIVQPSPPSR